MKQSPRCLFVYIYITIYIYGIVIFQAPGIVKYQTDQCKAEEKKKWLQDLGMGVICYRWYNVM